MTTNLLGDEAASLWLLCSANALRGEGTLHDIMEGAKDYAADPGPDFESVSTTTGTTCTPTSMRRPWIRGGSGCSFSTSDLTSSPGTVLAGVLLAHRFCRSGESLASGSCQVSVPPGPAERWSDV